MKFKRIGEKMSQNKSAYRANKEERRCSVVYVGPYLSTGSAPVSYSYSGVIKPTVIKNQTVKQNLVK